MTNRIRTRSLAWGSALGALMLSLLAPQARAQSAPVPASVRVEPSELVLEPGQRVGLRVNVFDAEGRPIQAPLTFVSTNPWALQVSGEGEVEALRPGEHRVLVHALKPHGRVSSIPPEQPDPYGGYVLQEVRVVVRAPAPARIEIHPQQDVRRVYVGHAVGHEARVLDAAGTALAEQAANWSTSDPTVATVSRTGKLQPRRPGRVTLVAETQGVRAERAYEVRPDPVARVELEASTRQARTGDVVHFTARALDAQGRPVEGAVVEFSVRSEMPDTIRAPRPPAQVDAAGRFVADLPGEHTVYAASGSRSAHATVFVTERNVSRPIYVEGHGPVSDQYTSDIWVWEGDDGRDYAITGTWNGRGTIYFWDVTDPAAIVRTDSVQVDARTVNDVKISEDGRIAVVSREGASNRRNGLVILDTRDPRNVEILSTFDDGLTGGVHNVFIYEGHVYALSAGRHYDIINIEDPRNPYRVSTFRLDVPGAGIHDVWVEDGIAYSSQWQEGVILVDVGNGIAGGSPSNPVQFAQYAYPTPGGTHTALPFRSKTGKFYVLAGDGMIWPGGIYTDEVSEPGGFIHVIDFTDLENPVEVARYEIPESGPHNYWIDEDEVLYIAHYTAGLRVVDLSGELMGDLYTQGREIARFKAYDPDAKIPNTPMAWGVMKHKGRIYFSDMHGGIWVMRLTPRGTPIS